MKRDLGTVGGPRGGIVHPRVCREPGLAGAVRVHDVDLLVAISVTDEGDPGAVGGPGGEPVRGSRRGRELRERRSAYVLDEDVVAGPAVRAERDLRAIGRPRHPNVRASVSELSHAGTVAVDEKNLTAAPGLIVEEGDLRAIRRPGRSWFERIIEVHERSGARPVRVLHDDRVVAAEEDWVGYPPNARVDEHRAIGRPVGSRAPSESDVSWTCADPSAFMT